MLPPSLCLCTQYKTPLYVRSLGFFSTGRFIFCEMACRANSACRKEVLKAFQRKDFWCWRDFDMIRRSWVFWRSVLLPLKLLHLKKLLRHILGRSGQKKLNKLISRRIINSLTKSSRGLSNLLFEEIVSQVFLSHYKRLFTLLLVASSVFCDPWMGFGCAWVSEDVGCHLVQKTVCSGPGWPKIWPLPCFEVDSVGGDIWPDSGILCGQVV